MPPVDACRTGSCPTPRRWPPTPPRRRRPAAASPIQASSLWAAAPAPARARMPSEAGRTSRDPVFFIPLRLISQSALFLNRVHKPQVSGLNENGGKFVKKPNDLIRRKFSIDTAFAIVSVGPVHPPFRNHTGSAFRNLAFTIRAECGRERGQN